MPCRCGRGGYRSEGYLPLQGAKGTAPTPPTPQPAQMLGRRPDRSHRDIPNRASPSYRARHSSPSFISPGQGLLERDAELGLFRLLANTADGCTRRVGIGMGYYNLFAMLVFIVFFVDHPSR